ncbi:MAG: LapA family protein [Gammaproteobacteria bacterium]|nr:MAG: LapA family protein [Gammaproteobacteria bacterium]
MALLKKIWVLLLCVLAILFGLAIVLANPQPLSLELLGYPLGPMPSGLWLLLALTCGCLLGVLVSLPALLRLKRRVYLQNRQMAKQKLGSSREQ